jgi:REP element-mobilizing transposase RayT
MPDHLHALISFPKDVNSTKTIAGWKEIVAKKSDIRWQRDFFDLRLRSHESHEEKAAYIRNNPVRKGLVSEAADWKFVWEST